MTANKWKQLAKRQQADTEEYISVQGHTLLRKNQENSENRDRTTSIQKAASYPSRGRLLITKNTVATNGRLKSREHTR